MTTPLQRFRETKFAKGGGSCFECSDYEGMYTELEQLVTELALKEKETVERIKDQIQSWLMKYDSKDGYSTLHDQVLEDLSRRVDTLTNEKR